MLNYREPAITATSLLVPTVSMAVLLATDLPAEAQAAWNALAVAIAGLVTAVVVVSDRLVPAVTGVAQAVLALLAVHGLGLTAEQATGLTAFVAAVAGAWVRTQVTVAAPNRHVLNH